uniref:Uncharacterized protein n=1 Tax=Cacopsylla melanoneura TaxID=428564 RepID=A0A8D8ZIA3_9HEMI
MTVPFVPSVFSVTSELLAMILNLRFPGRLMAGLMARPFLTSWIRWSSRLPCTKPGILCSCISPSHIIMRPEWASSVAIRIKYANIRQSTCLKPTSAPGHLYI